MQITITQITISYFKGIKELAIDCDKQINTVSGDNGTGKTTIADAIQWCLFGKNSSNDTRFGIMTLDTDGNVIPDVPHYVQLKLTIAGNSDIQVKTLKRVYIEEKKVWRGKEQDGVMHRTEYYIDDLKVSKDDYNNWIASLTTEDIFRLVTSPAYFFNLKWQEQRNMLQDLIKDVDYSDLNNAPEYKEIVPLIDVYGGLDGLKKTLTTHIKAIKGDIDKIPARQEEHQNMIKQFENTPWDTIQESLAEETEVIKQLQQQLVALKSNRQQPNLAELEQCNKAMYDIKQKVQEQLFALQTAQRQQEDKLIRQTSTLRLNIDNLISKKRSYKIFAERCKDTLQDIQEEIFAFRKEWNANELAEFQQLDGTDLICPTCGRPYEPSKVQELTDIAYKNFAQNKRARHDELLAKSKTIKQRQIEAQAQYDSYQEFINSFDISKQEADLNALNAELIKVSKNKIPTLKELLQSNTEYQQLQAKVAALQAQNNDAPNNTKITEMENSIKEHTDIANEYRAQLANKEIYEQHLNRIHELDTKLAELQKSLTGFTVKSFTVTNYERAMSELIEAHLNKHFKTVKFKLFDTLNDGTRKPWCMPTIAGVDYTDANRAAQINAALEICDVFAVQKDFIAPVIIDNAEAVNNIIDTLGQQFRFYVTKDNNLIIK